MGYTVIILEKARKDIFEAYLYYETIYPQLANRFETEVFDTIETIELSPFSYRKIKGNNRQLKLKSFSYVVVYRIEKQMILIARVFHTKRNPRSKF